MAEQHAPEDLLALCEAARNEGRDFPTIWTTILRGHPLVIGPPHHEMRDGEAIIVIPLLTRRMLLSSIDRLWLE